MQKVTPFLWFDDNAEEAIDFYMSVFKNAKKGDIHYWDKDVPDLGGKVMTATFEIEGQKFMAMDAGPTFKFTEAISLFVDCDNQKQVDEYWKKLTADGGEESQCGWLKDKYGMSWQIIPTEMMKYMGDKDPKKAKRALDAMLKMKKIDLAAIKKAHDGK